MACKTTIEYVYQNCLWKTGNWDAAEGAIMDELCSDSSH